MSEREPVDVVNDVWCCRECHDIGMCDTHPRPCNCTFEEDR